MTLLRVRGIALSSISLWLFCLGSPTIGYGQIVANDSATNSAYNGGWGTGTNGGTGFGAWQISSANGTGIAGRFIATTNSGGTIAGISGFVGNKAFGLYAKSTNSGAAVYANRTISNGLAVGQVFRFRWGLNFDSGATNGVKGFRLYAGGTNSTNTLLDLSMSNSPAVMINGSRLTSSNYGNQSFVVSIERRTSTQLRVTGTERTGTNTFDVIVPVPATAPDQFQFYASQLNSATFGDERQPYFSDLQVEQTSTPSTAISYSTITVAGDFQGWSATATPMSPVAGETNTWSVTAKVANAGAQLYKFTDGTWNAPWGISAVPGYAQLRRGDGFDIPITVTNTGIYTFRFNTDTLAYSFNRTLFSDYASFAAAYGLMGDQNWDDDSDGVSNLQEFNQNADPTLPPVGSNVYLPVANRWLYQHSIYPEASNALLFLGSSSIRRWEHLKRDFEDYQVIQRGMGGCTLGDVNQLLDKVVTPYAPRAIVMWAGVNDIHNGKTGDYVFGQYTNFIGTMTNQFPNTKIFYLGITRTPFIAASSSMTTERLSANAQIFNFVSGSVNTNLFYINLPALFENLSHTNLTAGSPSLTSSDLWYYFLDDIHMNRIGYLKWKQEVRNALATAGVSPDRMPVSNPLAPTGGKRILFDFGPGDSTNGDSTTSTDSQGNRWNNWYPVVGSATVVAGEWMGGVVDTSGSDTGVRLILTGDFQVNGKKNGGLTNIPSFTLGNLGTVTATEDYFYTTSDGLAGGGSDDAAGGLMISGLNPNLSYDLRFLGSRDTSGIRQSSYQVFGAVTNNPVIVQTSGTGAGINGSTGNNKSVAVISSVRPNIYGDIFIDVAAIQEATGATDTFAYVNAMEIDVVSSYEAWARSKGLTTGINNGLSNSNSSTGLSNLQSFAFDSNQSDGVGGMSKVRGKNVTGVGVQALNLAMPVRKGAYFSGSTSLSGTQDGVTYEVLGSSDLINWNLPVELVVAGDTSGLPSLSDPSGYEYRSFRIKDPTGALTKGFLKSVARTATGGSEAVVGARGVDLQAGNYTEMQGVQVDAGNGAVTYFDAGDWIKYSGTDFGSGATSVTFSAAKSGTGGVVEIRVGSPTGRLIGTFTPQDSGGWGNYKEQVVQLSGFVSGVQDLYLVGTGTTGVCNISSFRFSNYVLAWGDEFEGTVLNTSNWAAAWNGDVANGELEFYTDRTNNVSVTNGVLRLTAVRETYTGQGPWMSAPKTTEYTSGLVESLNKVQFQYGKVEARMKLPRGAGLWPAFYMMGTNYFTSGVGWPKCGEIDIMEHVNSTDSFTAAFHTGSYNYLNGGGGITNVQGYSISDYDTNFHVYGLEWTPAKLAFYVDGKILFTATKAQLGSSQDQWPFDQPFWMKLNLAVGGSYGGDPTSGTFPKTMEVDWVRVYQDQAATN